MSEKVKEPKAPIDFSHLGGKRLHTADPVKGDKEINFSAIGGKVVQRSHLWAETKPAESKEDDSA